MHSLFVIYQALVRWRACALVQVISYSVRFGAE
jgi:hypothetical protein